MSFFFFSPRLEVWGMRLKDRFLTHGGLALWSRKHKWCGCLSVPLCCCPPPPPPPRPPPTLSLCSFLPHAAHCALVTHSSFSPLVFPPPFPVLRAAGARGLGDGFHGYWLQRLDASSQLPVVVRQPDIHSYQVRLIFFFSQTFSCTSFSLPFSATALVLCLQIHHHTSLRCLFLLRSFALSYHFSFGFFFC